MNLFIFEMQSENVVVWSVESVQEKLAILQRQLDDNLTKKDELSKQV